MNFVRNENDADWRARELSVRCLYGVKQRYLGVITMMRTFLELNYQGYLTTQDIRVNVDVTTPQLQYPYDQSFATYNMHP